MTLPSSTWKMLIGWIFCLAFRLLPFRPANMEPVMAAMLPFAKRESAIISFVFPSAIMIVFDLLLGMIGPWTWMTAAAYGLVGVGTHFYLRNRFPSALNFAIAALVGTIAFDVMTLTIGPLMGQQAWSDAVIGQIPFTAYHVAGNLFLSAVISPFLHRWVIENERLELVVPRRAVSQ